MHALACEYARAPSKAALNGALEAALPLCALIARRFSGRGVDYEDLYQVAAMACVKALEGFDPTMGMKFSTYVTPTVTGRVRNYIRDKAQLLRTPRAVHEQAAQLHQAREQFVKDHRREPTSRELADILSWDMAKVLTALSARAAGDVLSLDAEDQDGIALAQRLSGVEAGFEQSEQRQDLQKAMTVLSHRERQLLSLRYEQKFSQRETARRMALSQMQVSRMEKRILTTLRKEMEA